MGGHKISLSKFRKIEVLPAIFPNLKRRAGRSTYMWKLNNTLLNNQLVKEDQMQSINVLKLVKIETKDIPTYEVLQKQL